VIQNLKKLFRLSDWREVRNIGKHSYQICAQNGKRRIIDTQPGVGYQPVDRNFLLVDAVRI